MTICQSIDKFVTSSSLWHGFRYWEDEPFLAPRCIYGKNITKLSITFKI